MRKNKTIIAAVLICLGLILISGLTIGNRKEQQFTFSEEYVTAQELAPLLSFTYYETDKWQEIIPTLVKGKVSYKELEALLDYMGVQEYVTYEEKAGFQKVPRTVFFQVYSQLIGILDVDNRVIAENRVFIGEQPEDEAWLTQKGYETVAGGAFYIEPYDMYRVYTLNGEIIGLEKRITEAVTWENVFIHSIEEGTAQVLFERELIEIPIPQLTEGITDTVCDMEWKDSAVSAIYKKEETIQGTVLSYNDRQIEIAGYGTLEHDGNLRIYKTYGTVEQLDESKLVIGNLMADFVVAEGRVCGIILKEPVQIDLIRVLLLNGESPYYPELYVTANEEITVTFGENQQKLPGNTVVKASEYWKDNQDGYIRIELSTENGNLFLTNERGEAVSLGYQGSFEIRRYEEGYGIVSELTLEDYLCAVVPSEMPASYEVEALRAQAVCARSYACIQLENAKYAGFAANVDDSTNYQVYNKQERNEKTTLAVRDTVGEVLKYNGVIAEAYYYSTSCGFSQNIDVWNLENGGENGYLQSISLLVDGSVADFSKEEVFAEFIQNKECMAYDSDAGYFRWRAELDLEGHKEQLYQAMEERRAANPENVQIFDSNGNQIECNFTDLGRIEMLLPQERSAGGILRKLRIQCEKGSILVTTEYNIRKILGEAAVEVTDKYDKAITVLDLLPSAAFTAIPVEQGYILYGGGYGHGIGLSQNGANGMAKSGMTYTDILQKFYQNITIENIYNSPDGT